MEVKVSEIFFSPLGSDIQQRLITIKIFTYRMLGCVLSHFPAILKFLHEVNYYLCFFQMLWKCTRKYSSAPAWWTRVSWLCCSVTWVYCTAAKILRPCSAQDKTKEETMESTNWKIRERVALTSSIQLTSPFKAAAKQIWIMPDFVVLSVSQKIQAGRKRRSSKIQG